MKHRWPPLGALGFALAACANSGGAAPDSPEPEPPLRPEKTATGEARAEPPSESSAADAGGACIPGGCSGELCVDRSEPVMSPCMYRSEYACYKEARCERGSDGKCGWVQTAELEQCLSEKSAP